MQKWLYSFGPRGVDGSMHMRSALGGKGASLADMSRLGLPVPPGFTLTISCCAHYFENNEQLTTEMIDQIDEAILRLEGETGRILGNYRNPLLVSVRPGAKHTMPGIMDTVLCLGATPELIDRWVDHAKVDGKIIWNAYRRYIRNYGELVLQMDTTLFDSLIQKLSKEHNIQRLYQLDARRMREVALEFKQLVEDEFGVDFPANPKEQLYKAIAASFSSWNAPRAKMFRKMHDNNDEGAAVTVQLQILGLKEDDQSGSGFCFSRNPETGENTCTGSFVSTGLGEDYLDPQHEILPLRKTDSKTPLKTLEAQMPWIWHDLLHFIEVIEKWYGTMRQLEFCVEDGKLWLLQAHKAEPKTPQAALKVAVDMVKEGMIRRQDAIMNIRPEQLERLLHPTIKKQADLQIFARGMAASPGAVSGKVCFSTKQVLLEKECGNNTILVAEETRPNDAEAMVAASGIMTTRGGITSHAAVIARGLNCPCITAVKNMHLDSDKQQLRCNGSIVNQGDFITLDGHTGMVYLGEAPITPPDLNEDFSEFMSWVDMYRHMHIRANGESRAEIETARRFGAEGIGLVRTEYMFLKEERLNLVRQMILADDSEKRAQVLKQILPMQRDDFLELFRLSQGWNVAIRLLDPPLHEFLPNFEDHEEIDQLAHCMGQSVKQIKARILTLRETNPMLGHRGGRLAVTSPEIYNMQAKAIFEALALAYKEEVDVALEIIVPLICLNTEIETVNQQIQEIAQQYQKKIKPQLKWKIGCMIETPRAAIRAEEIARIADFFSFGTNDLTQMTWGLSRDDSAAVIRSYLDNNIISYDPFQRMDFLGVGELIKLAVQRGRASNPDLSCGVCGEHGGNPETIDFCADIGVNYISCSPWRVPVARLAAAQAELNKMQKQ